MKVEITNKDQECRLVLIKTSYPTGKESYTQVEPGETIEVDIRVTECSFRLQEIAME